MFDLYFYIDDYDDDDGDDEKGGCGSNTSGKCYARCDGDDLNIMKKNPQVNCAKITTEPLSVPFFSVSFTELGESHKQSKIEKKKITHDRNK